MKNGCSVHGCITQADYEVIFYDMYRYGGRAEVFYERHNSCPYLCEQHMSENELGAVTRLPDPDFRAYRGIVDYPHTRSRGQGFVIYRPLMN